MKLKRLLLYCCTSNFSQTAVAGPVIAGRTAYIKSFWPRTHSAAILASSALLVQYTPGDFRAMRGAEGPAWNVVDHQMAAGGGKNFGFNIK